MSDEQKDVEPESVQEEAVEEDECPPFMDRKFWEWLRAADAKNARKREIGENVRDFIEDIVEEFTEDDYDPRRDIAWYMEQLGCNLRSEVEKEIASKRQAARAAQRDE